MSAWPPRGEDDTCASMAAGSHGGTGVGGGGSSVGSSISNSSRGHGKLALLHPPLKPWAGGRSRSLARWFALLVGVVVLLHVLLRVSCPCRFDGGRNSMRLVADCGGTADELATAAQHGLSVAENTFMTTHNISSSGTRNSGNSSSTSIGGSSSNSSSGSSGSSSSSSSSTSTSSSSTTTTANKTSPSMATSEFGEKVQHALEPILKANLVDPTELAAAVAARPAGGGAKQLVVLLVASQGYLDMLLNCARSLTRVGLAKYILVAAFDVETEEFSRRHGWSSVRIRHLADTSSTTTGSGSSSDGDAAGDTEHNAHRRRRRIMQNQEEEAAEEEEEEEAAAEDNGQKASSNAAADSVAASGEKAGVAEDNGEAAAHAEGEEEGNGDEERGRDEREEENWEEAVREEEEAGGLVGTNRIAEKDVSCVVLVLQLLQRLRVEVLLVDLDTVWFRDPLAAVRKDRLYPGDVADVLVSSDSLSWENDDMCMRSNQATAGMVVDDFAFATARSEESFGTVYSSEFNTGIFLARPTDASVFFFQTWAAILISNGGVLGWQEDVYSDQDAFTRIARHGSLFKFQLVGASVGQRAHPRVFWVFEHRLRLGVLSPADFVTGHAFFVQQLPELRSRLPVAVHNTFQFYKADGKRWRFRERQLWTVDEDRWYTEGKFLSFGAAMPDDVLQHIRDPVDKHAAAIAFYYLSIRNALAIAMILNRTLILPAVTCYCDKYWWSLQVPCRMPGADEEPPYHPCPMDMYLNITAWEASGLAFRPHSFLSHPRVPRAVTLSKEVVRIVLRTSSDERDAAQHQSMVQQSQRRHSLPANALDHEVVERLGGLSGIRVLHLESTADAFCRFKSRKRNEDFDARTLAAGLFSDQWCCSPWNSEWGQESDENLAYRRFRAPRPLSAVQLKECDVEPVIALELER